MASIIRPTSTFPASGPATDAEFIPPLENGDRLTREEFERRYDAMPDLKKAELIDGVVYMASPVRQSHHSHSHFRLISWLGIYELDTPGVEGGDNSSVRLDMGNEPQPDAFLYIKPEHGGHARIDRDGYLDGAPDLVAEVAASSASYDLDGKFHAYRRNGVREYIVWRVLDRQLDWFVLREDRFERMVQSPDGVIRSGAFPGLWLDPQALVAGDAARLRAVANAGLDSAEHAAFVAKLVEAQSRGDAAGEA
ncbi:hypothetical protein OJF2_09040 [Aquisphaera giovannonii]|uniref:Putative restriction endonuclease domain-containing protein n=1 Tax=Aquisphaera giovannonii TaxID=406548 RepID=A0A5B9VVQ8_9BACT|nr:Uma2 family endonuclease [Aquisphaera giovannonii]QEH32433.1 hypothetical protein OJF2_09040 [Aquisphaera giovannonii]